MKGQTLSCKIYTYNDAPDREFAFYVYRDDKRVHVQWYSSSSVVEYDTNNISGYYRVNAFAKDSDGSLENKKSFPILGNPTVIAEDTIDELIAKEGAYHLQGNFWKFPALYYPSTKKTLFVLMPSAIDRDKYTLPAFSRWRWAKHFPGDVLCVADPTLHLHENLRLGWCIGNSDYCATSDLAQFVLKLAQKRGIPRDKIVFYGSSAGGFAALALSARIEGSIAVAINAQTDALSYEASDQVSLVRQMCFNDMPEGQIRDLFADRVNMVPRWSKVQSSRVFLVQNVLDKHHYNIHFKPFWNFLGGGHHHGVSTSGRHTAWTYENDAGHVAETLEMAQEIIQRLNLEQFSDLCT